MSGLDRLCATPPAKLGLAQLRRARRREVAAELVDPLAVFERDDWRCYICGEPTIPELYGTHDPLAPETDHVVPLCQGGQHSYVNVRCACRRCNAFKADRALSEVPVDIAQRTLTQKTGAYRKAGRKARPNQEKALVADAASIMAVGSDKSAAQVARALSQQVVDELIAFLDEEADPVRAAMGELRRKIFPTAACILATDPDIDTLALFVAGRIERVRNRNGRYLTPSADKIEYQEVMSEISETLFRRYLKHLRAR